LSNVNIICLAMNWLKKSVIIVVEKELQSWYQSVGATQGTSAWTRTQTKKRIMRRRITKFSKFVLMTTLCFSSIGVYYCERSWGTNWCNCYAKSKLLWILPTSVPPQSLPKIFAIIAFVRWDQLLWLMTGVQLVEFMTGFHPAVISKNVKWGLTS
jgi:hypothetical protein